MLIKALCVQLAITRFVVRGAFKLGVAGGVVAGAAGVMLPVVAACAARRMRSSRDCCARRTPEPAAT